MAQPAYQPQPVYQQPAPAPVRRTWGVGSFAVRALLTLAGAGGLIIGSFMDWARNTAGTDVSIRALWQPRFLQSGNDLVTTAGFVTIVLGLIAVVGLAPRTGALTRLAGALGVVAFILFLIEVYRADLTVADLDVGIWIVLAGGLVALIGGLFGTRPRVVTTTAPPATQ
jgi:hypothetical protein